MFEMLWILFFLRHYRDTLNSKLPFCIFMDCEVQGSREIR